MAWAESRTREFRQRFGEILSQSPCSLHDYFDDHDANMSFIAMSGDAYQLRLTVQELWHYGHEVIDLTRHGTQYERLGALAELDWFGLRDEEAEAVQTWAGEFFGSFDVPVVPLDRFTKSVSDTRAAQLLESGFGSLGDLPISGALGASVAHPRLGATMMSLRPFSLRMSFHMPHFSAKEVEGLVEGMRLSGDSRFRGVTARFLRGWFWDRIYMTFDYPDEVDPDPAIQWLQESVRMLDHPRIIGAIRESDRLGCQRATWDERQVLR